MRGRSADHGERYPYPLPLYNHSSAASGNDLSITACIDNLTAINSQRKAGNAALIAVQNQNALVSAATSRPIGIIGRQMYGKTTRELDETQKQTVSTLATLVGDSSASAVFRLAGREDNGEE